VLGLPLALVLSISLLVLTLLLVPSQVLVLILPISALALKLAITIVLGTSLIPSLPRFAQTLVLPSSIWRRLAGRAVQWRLPLALSRLLSLASVLRPPLALSRLCLGFMLTLARCSAGISA
jgi:hypothetical protein